MLCSLNSSSLQATRRQEISAPLDLQHLYIQIDEYVCWCPFRDFSVLLRKEFLFERNPLSGLLWCELMSLDRQLYPSFPVILYWCWLCSSYTPAVICTKYVGHPLFSWIGGSISNVSAWFVWRAKTGTPNFSTSGLDGGLAVIYSMYPRAPWRKVATVSTRKMNAPTMATDPAAHIRSNRWVFGGQ